MEAEKNDGLTARWGTMEIKLPKGSLRIVSQHELIVSRDSEIEQLKLLIAKLRRMQVRPFVGEAGSADRTTGVAARSAAAELG